MSHFLLSLAPLSGVGDPSATPGGSLRPPAPLPDFRAQRPLEARSVPKTTQKPSAGGCASAGRVARLQNAPPGGGVGRGRRSAVVCCRRRYSLTAGGPITRPRHPPAGRGRRLSAAWPCWPRLSFRHHPRRQVRRDLLRPASQGCVRRNPGRSPAFGRSVVPGHAVADQPADERQDGRRLRHRRGPRSGDGLQRPVDGRRTGPGQQRQLCRAITRPRSPLPREPCTPSIPRHRMRSRVEQARAATLRGVCQ